MNRPENNTSLAERFPGEGDIPSPFNMEPLHQRRYLKQGELLPWNGPVADVMSPVYLRSTLALRPRIIGSYPVFGERESMEILESAVAAYDRGHGAWPTSPPEERIRCIREFGARMMEKRDIIAGMLMWETGKSHADSAREFDRTMTNLDTAIQSLASITNESARTVTAEGIAARVGRAPVGVVLCMGPYNYPLYETFSAVVPAIAMGNTVIIKPPRYGVLIFEPLLEAFRDCFPRGVVNLLYGDGPVIVPPLMRSGTIDMLAFIGTHPVAESLKRLHPRPHRLRCALGLGAKNAAVIMADADLPLAVKETLLGSLAFNGQRCAAIKIIFVHSSIAADFLGLFCSELGKLRLGMPWEEGVFLTPLAEPGKPVFLGQLIDDALSRGAGVANRGGGDCCESLFYPAVLYPVDASMRIYHEEQFGPIVPVVPFDDVNEPIRFITESDYGQQAALFGKDGRKMGKLIDPLVNQVARVNINCKCQRGPDILPFTGRKDSAEGTLSVSDAIRAFSVSAVVAERLHDGEKGMIDDIILSGESHLLRAEPIE